MAIHASPIILTRFVSPRELSQLTGLSVGTLIRLRKIGDLPDPVRVSPGRIGWPRAVVETWIESRIPKPSHSVDEDDVA